jgi:hypothetical protein
MRGFAYEGVRCGRDRTISCCLFRGAGRHTNNHLCHSVARPDCGRVSQRHGQCQTVCDAKANPNTPTYAETDNPTDGPSYR